METVFLDFCASNYPKLTIFHVTDALWLIKNQEYIRTVAMPL